MDYDSSKDFTTLQAWQKARAVRNFFYEEIIRHLPIEEKYNLGVQMRRASVSATANIAEGYGRFHFREGAQFYRIARGSIYELKDLLICCSDLQFTSSDICDRGLQLIEEAKSTLNGYIRFVTSKLKD